MLLDPLSTPRKLEESFPNLGSRTQFLAGFLVKFSLKGGHLILSQIYPASGSNPAYPTSFRVGDLNEENFILWCQDDGPTGFSFGDFQEPESSIERV